MSLNLGSLSVPKDYNLFIFFKLATEYNPSGFSFKIFTISDISFPGQTLQVHFSPFA